MPITPADKYAQKVRNPIDPKWVLIGTDHNTAPLITNYLTFQNKSPTTVIPNFFALFLNRNHLKYSPELNSQWMDDMITSRAFFILTHGKLEAELKDKLSNSPNFSFDMKWFINFRRKKNGGTWMEVEKLIEAGYTPRFCQERRHVIFRPPPLSISIPSKSTSILPATPSSFSTSPTLTVSPVLSSTTTTTTSSSSSSSSSSSTPTIHSEEEPSPLSPFPLKQQTNSLEGQDPEREASSLPLPDPSVDDITASLSKTTISSPPPHPSPPPTPSSTVLPPRPPPFPPSPQIKDKTVNNWVGVVVGRGGGGGGGGGIQRGSGGGEGGRGNRGGNNRRGGGGGGPEWRARGGSCYYRWDGKRWDERGEGGIEGEGRGLYRGDGEGEGRRWSEERIINHREGRERRERERRVGENSGSYRGDVRGWSERREEGRRGYYQGEGRRWSEGGKNIEGDKVKEKTMKAEEEKKEKKEVEKNEEKKKEGREGEGGFERK